MLLPTRQMRLTAALAASVPPLGDGRTERRADLVDATEDDHLAVLADLLSGRPSDGQVWLFAYGSLIWNPGFEHAEERIALLSGWHRSFCLGWMTFFRGSVDRPGLMLALDRGGSCKGVAFRLPPDGIEQNLLPVIRRELPFRVSSLRPRWVTARTAQGPVRAIVFPIDRTRDAYLGGLTEDTVVASLATSVGERGTMAEYLQSTVSHLEDRGIHDRYLWRLQDLVARRIEASCGTVGT